MCRFGQNLYIYNVHDRIYDEIPAKDIIYTPYIHDFGQPYACAISMSLPLLVPTCSCARLEEQADVHTCAMYTISTSLPLLVPTCSSAGLEELADFIATNYMGMGKSAADALPELRRRGVVPAGRGLYSFEGSTMRAHDIAARMRLQVVLGPLCYGLRRMCGERSDGFWWGAACVALKAVQ
jgi:hypothetical protein